MKALLVGATRHIAARPLRESGFIVAEAWTAAEARSAAEAVAPDVVLVGDAVARSSPNLCVCLRSAAEDALVIVVEAAPGSASASASTAEPMPDFGAHAYLRQPLVDHELLAAIRTLLLARRLTSTAEAKASAGAALTAAAHRIRNPLASLLVASTMLKTDHDLGEHAHRIAETIARNVEEVSRSIEALLDTSRLIGESRALTLSMVDLRDVVRTAVASLDDTAAATGVDLSLPSEPMMVLADPERLRLAVRHLIFSARAHGPDVVAIEMSRDGANAKVTVRSADGSPALPWEGEAELGVSLARDVIGHHGGEVSLHGQTGWFVLKLQHDTAAAS